MALNFNVRSAVVQCPESQEVYDLVISKSVYVPGDQVFNTEGDRDSFFLANTNRLDKEGDEYHPFCIVDGELQMWISDPGSWTAGMTAVVGPKGDTGPMPVISIGTVSVGAPGSQPTVTDTGTPENPILNFTIPAGVQGATATIQISPTITGLAGTQANVANLGTIEQAKLQFTIPRGDKGADGNTPVITVVENTSTSYLLRFTTGTNILTTPNLIGPAGTSPTVVVQSTATLPAGSNATVTNAGTNKDVRLQFGIPKGDKGDTGAKGTNATVQIGTVSTGLPGSNATVTNSGTSSAAILNFSIPEGRQGAQGIPGQNGVDGVNGTNGINGAAATITVGETVTLEPGNNALVQNTGTTSVAVLKFSIPKGAKGDTPDISVGTVTTGEPGTEAAAEITGTSPHLTLNLTIPEGQQGAAATNNITARGEWDPLTADGTHSLLDPDDPDYEAPYGLNDLVYYGDWSWVRRANYNDTTPEEEALPPSDNNPLWVHFVGRGPQGIQGQAGVNGADGVDGVDGAPGEAATIVVEETITLEPGNDALVENVGDSTNAILKFSIPKGATGATGATGNRGSLWGYTSDILADPGSTINLTSVLLNGATLQVDDMLISTNQSSKGIYGIVTLLDEGAGTAYVQYLNTIYAGMEWGHISGTISDQSDLINLLNNLQPNIGGEGNEDKLVATDEDGDITYIAKDSIGAVKDVFLNGESVLDENNIAQLNIRLV